MNDSQEILNELKGLMTGFWLTDLANFSAHLYHSVQDLNWIGFYLSDGKKLRLGPFAGKPACVEIEFDRGVCGKAYRERQTLRVDDVHAFPGHITCDPASRSELVIPFYVQGKLVGVLDIDSPKPARFSEADAVFFQEAIQVLESVQGLPFEGS